jgi:hypothetical protein
MWEEFVSHFTAKKQQPKTLDAFSTICSGKEGGSKAHNWDNKGKTKPFVIMLNKINYSIKNDQQNNTTKKQSITQVNIVF